MNKAKIWVIGCSIALSGLVSVPSLNAQIAEQSAQSALAREAGTLSDKFAGLARVMAGKYEWKPGEGVRSTGEVFNLIVMENGMLNGVLSGTGMPVRGGQRPAPITDPEKLQEALRTSYATLQKTISGLSDTDLKAPVKLFGRDMTRESAIRFLFSDQHEHLGQSIAYARSNGVTPPWSK